MKKLDVTLNISSLVVLLLVSSILGFIGKPTEMALSILAGSLGFSFLNIDKIKKFKGAGFEAEMKEKMQAIIDKETEPIQNDREIEISLEFDHKTKAVMKSLSDPKYTWRYLGGIVRDTNISRDKVYHILKQLLEKNIAKMTEGEHGKLWTLSPFGRKLIGKMR